MSEFDVNSHTFALIATVGLFHQATGSGRFDRFATSQRNWLLGGNAWGVSAMVGVGTRFPLCMQHQIANLNGTTDGTPPIDVGAVVNGPNSAGIFRGGLGGFQDAMVRCPAKPSGVYRPYDGRGSRYVDDVRSWQTDEPALDMTGAAIIAAAVQLTTPHSSCGSAADASDCVDGDQVKLRIRSISPTSGRTWAGPDRRCGRRLTPPLAGVLWSGQHG